MRGCPASRKSKSRFSLLLYSCASTLQMPSATSLENHLVPQAPGPTVDHDAHSALLTNTHHLSSRGVKHLLHHLKAAQHSTHEALTVTPPIV